MGNRHNKQEIFEPTLHAASRQTSQEAPAVTQNDVLTPYFEQLQSEREKECQEVRSETSVLCATAAPSEENRGDMNATQPPTAVSTLPPVATPYEDIPFKLTAGLVTESGPTDLSAVNEGMKRNVQSLQYRYSYDFNLERSVLRDSQWIMKYERWTVCRQEAFCGHFKCYLYIVK